MNDMLHIINGDCAGNSLLDSAIPGEVLVCHDLLYDGVRNPGWPSNSSLIIRSQFLSQLTGGGMSSDSILETLKSHYRKLSTASNYDTIVLWFDACLCDQVMLAHILVCLKHIGSHNVELLCIDTYPGIVDFNGLGQLQSSQLASLFSRRCSITSEQLEFADVVDKAFATQDLDLFTELSQDVGAPLPFIPASVTRWLQEQPDPETGLGRLESLALQAIRNGSKSPGEIFSSVVKDEKSPQFWGDTILWQKINGLADKDPPLVQIKGPAEKLPQWQSPIKLDRFTVIACP